MTKCCKGQLQYEDMTTQHNTTQYDRKRAQGKCESVTSPHPQPHPSCLAVLLLKTCLPTCLSKLAKGHFPLRSLCRMCGASYEYLPRLVRASKQRRLRPYMQIDQNGKWPEFTTVSLKQRDMKP